MFDLTSSKQLYQAIIVGGFTLLLVTAISSAASQPLHQSQQLPQISLSPKEKIPTGIPLWLWNKRIPRPSSQQSVKVLLGQMLFFDKRLSSDGSVSCATCHDPAMAFASKQSVAIGKERGTRNAPTLLNAAFADSYFWDGRVGTLEEQAKQPLLNESEMAMATERLLVQRVSSIKEYRSQFRRVFGIEAISLNTIAGAIAAFERTLVSANSPFDRYMSGDKTAISEAQKRGWELFKSKAHCIECHRYARNAPFFTDASFHNTGVGLEPMTFEGLIKSAQLITGTDQTLNANVLAHQSQFSQLGRFVVTGKWEDLAAFKTPSLRDIELTGPYMHDGSLGTLLDVVRFYNSGGTRNQMLDRRIKALELSEGDMNDIVEFLRALTSDDVLRLAQTSKSQTRERVVLPE